MKNTLIIILALILTCVGINAQENTEQTDQREVVVELISGTIMEGTINEWIIEEYLDLRTAWSKSITIPANIIKKVIQKSTMDAMSMNHYRFREKGIYYSAKAQFIAGNEGPRANAVNGIGASFSVGHRFNRFVCLGGGIGYDRFVWNSGENFVPLFLEYTSYLVPKNTSLYANVQAGYSLAFEDEDNLLISAKGGFMVYPAIGLRIGSLENKFTMDLGYKFQKAELTYADNWSPTRSEQRLTYKRLTFRIGILM